MHVQLLFINILLIFFYSVSLPCIHMLDIHQYLLHVYYENKFDYSTDFNS